MSDEFWVLSYFKDPRNLSRLPCLPRETLLLFHWGNAVYGVKCKAYFTGTRKTRPPDLIFKSFQGAPKVSVILGVEEGMEIKGRAW